MARDPVRVETPAAPVIEPAVPEYDTDAVPAEHRADVRRLAELDRQAAQLRTKLAEAGVVVAVKPHAPSFGMSEGTREELERTGKATDPFTGKALTRDDLKTKE